MTKWHEDFEDEPALFELADQFVFEDEPKDIELNTVVNNELHRLEELEDEFEEFVDLVFG